MLLHLVRPSYDDRATVPTLGIMIALRFLSLVWRQGDLLEMLPYLFALSACAELVSHISPAWGRRRRPCETFRTVSHCESFAFRTTHCLSLCRFISVTATQTGWSRGPAEVLRYTASFLSGLYGFSVGARKMRCRVKHSKCRKRSLCMNRCTPLLLPLSAR